MVDLLSPQAHHKESIPQPKNMRQIVSTLFNGDIIKLAILAEASQLQAHTKTEACSISRLDRNVLLA